MPRWACFEKRKEAITDVVIASPDRPCAVPWRAPEPEVRNCASGEPDLASFGPVSSIVQSILVEQAASLHSEEGMELQVVWIVCQRHMKLKKSTVLIAYIKFRVWLLLFTGCNCDRVRLSV